MCDFLPASVQEWVFAFEMAFGEGVITLRFEGVTIIPLAGLDHVRHINGATLPLSTPVPSGSVSRSCTDYADLPQFRGQ